MFDDSGFEGVLLNLKHFNKVKILNSQNNLDENQKVFVGAGIILFALNQKLKSLGLSGLEWSYGIPATLGGLIVMNGGSFEHEICEFIEKVFVFDGEKFLTLKKDQIEFSYRHSSLKGNYVVLGAVLNLTKDKSENIEQKMKSFFEIKKSSQPCEFPSLGSVFKRFKKNNEMFYPAKIIDKMGLKGAIIGRAQISLKHAGFIINLGGATSQDYLKLIEFIEKKFSEIGLKVEREIIVLR